MAAVVDVRDDLDPFGADEEDPHTPSVPLVSAESAANAKADWEQLLAIAYAPRADSPGHADACCEEPPLPLEPEADCAGDPATEAAQPTTTTSVNAVETAMGTLTIEQQAEDDESEPDVGDQWVKVGSVCDGGCAGCVGYVAGAGGGKCSACGCSLINHMRDADDDEGAAEEDEDEDNDPWDEDEEDEDSD
eukprot:m51a1_g2244 hypothetical protein (191) ;mRNA; f:287035-287661